jgi:6-phosphogluconolactonase (cycloisomerase 2 family)
VSAAAHSSASLSDRRQRLRAGAVLLGVAFSLAWAAPARAQLTLNVIPPFNGEIGAIGVNSFVLQASGGTPPYAFSITPGFPAPPGFRVQTGLQLPTGFPAGAGGFLGVATTPGTFTTSIRVTDATAATLDQPLTFNISLLQMSQSPPKATLNVAGYSYTFTGFGGSGGPGYTWSATGLPPGMNLSPSGVLSGTPTTAGNFGLVITLTDSMGTPPLNAIRRVVAITVDPFAITTPGLLPNATAGVFYSQTLSAPGCTPTATWVPISFAGLSLDAAGVLSGVPVLQHETSSFTATVTCGDGTSVSKVFSLFVTSSTTPLQSGFGGFADETIGNFITEQILPVGGTPPYTASVVSGTLPSGLALVGLPSGLALVGPGETVCDTCAPSLPYIAGRAMATGTYTFTLTFTDSMGASFTPPAYTWRISPISNQVFVLPPVGTPLTTLTVGTPYTQPLLEIGGSGVYTFVPCFPLPAGLSIDRTTGVISGTPTEGGGVTAQILITDANNSVAELAAFIKFNVSGPPTVMTAPATNVTNTSATLNATVDAAGFPATGTFQWGPSTAYGNTTPPVSFPANFNTVNMTADITGLNCVAGRIYYYRAMASSSQGTSFGVDGTFTCGWPQVNTFSADFISAHSARLNGNVNPNGLATNAWFQWGTTTNYDNTTPFQSVGAGTTFVSIPSAVITGLNCGTLYHFQAAAFNGGSSAGNDVTFATDPCALATTGVAIQIGLTNATLIGSVNPGGTAGAAHFEWGTTTAYGNSTPTQAFAAGFDTVPLAMTSISSLSCNTPYHFRTVATNAFGSNVGDDRQFMTAPCTAGSFRGIVYAMNNYPFTNLIYGYGVTSAGALIQLPGFPVPTGGVGQPDGLPERLTYDAAKHRLYAINVASNTLSVYSVATRTGVLAPMPFSPIALPPGLPISVHVHPSGSPVIVASIDGHFLNNNGRIASYTITAATATLAEGSPFPTGVAYTFSTAFSRDGNYLYAGAGDEIGTDPSTAGFTVNPGTGVLTPLAGSPFALGGAFPIGYATDTAGRLFAVNNEGDQIRAFTTSAGVPTAVLGNPFPAPLLNPVSGAVHPSGFYVVADGGDQLGVYQISGSGAATTLTNVTDHGFHTGGSGTASLAISNDGNFVFAGNAGTLNVTVFGIDRTTGHLNTLSVQPAGTLGNVGDISGVAFAPSSAPVGDYDGDGKTDPAVFRPSNGTWYLLQSSTNYYTTFVAQAWGLGTDVPVWGDYDGDGKSDFAVFRPSNGTWYILTSSSNYTSAIVQAWGVGTDIPVPGDYDGDGKTDFAVFRPSTGTWYVLLSGTNYTTFVEKAWGLGTDVPVPGDYDGDGKTDPAVFRPSTGTWYWLQSSTNFTSYVAQAWGMGTDTPVPGDYDGDGKTDPAVFRPSTGMWYWLRSSTNFTSYVAQAWGVGTDTPVPGDYDGDGKTDPAIFRPVNGEWDLLQSSSSYTTFFTGSWGLATDVPILKRP